jgi:ribonuclease BN (tRNA processing enzyme)
VNIKFLGTHNAESQNTRLVTLLIDDIIAIDTGCLTSELTYPEQEKIKAILLTHGHYDHIRGVPAYAFNNYCDITKVYGTQPALDMVTTHLVDGIIYPDFTRTNPMCDQRSLELIPVTPDKDIDLHGYTILPLSVNHKLGAVGFYIIDPKGKRIFISGDTGKGLADLWKKITPDLLIIEVTFPDNIEQTAIDAQHLCPKMLKKELQDFFKIQGYYPRIIIIHLCPKLEDEIRKDIKMVEKELDITIEIAQEGQKIKI